MARLPYKIVQNRVSREAQDPHASEIFWRYHGKWGLHLKGSELRVEHKDTWSWGGAQYYVPTPERITLWYELMKEVTEDNL